jgi:hypothetical protein
VEVRSPGIVDLVVVLVEQGGVTGHAEMAELVASDDVLILLC